MSRRTAWILGGLVVLLLWPVTGALSSATRFSLLGNAIVSLEYAIAGVSLVVLVGYVGQISLAQASFVGIGAFSTGLIVRGWHIPFPLSLPLAAGVSAATAALLGLVALRVRGLYLAVATLIFAWMTDAYLFSQPWLVGSGGSSAIPPRPIGKPDTIPFLDFTSRTTFYYIALAVAAAILFGVANLRDSKTGRAFFAVKGSEMAAASLGIDIVRTKLSAFAVSGFIAGVAGNLIMTHELVATPISFGFTRSLFYLSIAVVGGLTSLGGVVASAVVFGALEQVFYRVDALHGFLEVVSAALLGAVLLFFPGGLARVPEVVGIWTAKRRERKAARESEHAPAVEETTPAVTNGHHRRPVLRLDRFLRARTASDGAPDALRTALERDQARTPEPQPQPETETTGLRYVAGAATRVLLPPREERAVIMAARDITVRFGGLVAVNDATIEVREGEIVGLIGPNGAGKTTLFNAISGLNEPARGRVELFGKDATTLAVHERARLGMGRTFQVIQLFPQLTVFDNLLVATHTRNTSRFASHLVVSKRGADEERKARDRVQHVIDLLGLHEVAERRVAGLPFGMLRLVEIGRALVTGSPFVMLDEPASGLDNNETERFMDLLFWIRQTLGVSILLIEHDVRMVTSVCDYVYVINRGTPLAEGTPEEIQRHPEVVAAYLGEAAEPIGANA